MEIACEALVRDRIPEIIPRTGHVPVVGTASPEDYGRYAHAKLREELEEYLSSGDVVEVADLVQVCFAAEALHGVGQDKLLAIVRDNSSAAASMADSCGWGNTSTALTPSTTCEWLVPRLSSSSTNH